MTENRTGPQTIEFLTKRIVALGAVQSGHFLVDCETFMSVPQLGESRLKNFNYYLLKFHPRLAFKSQFQRRLDSTESIFCRCLQVF